MATHGERISILELEVKMLRTELSLMNTKLDDLLRLRYKGMGAFWLATALVGTGILGVVTQLFGWINLSIGRG